MKSRWFSRGLLVSVALVSSLGVAACARGQSGAEEAPPKPAAAEAEAGAWGQRGPGQRVFRQIDALDLSDDQRADLREIEDTLSADLSSQRQTVRQVAEVLARGVETGALDPQEAARQEEALRAAVTEARASVVTAMNDVHAVLDADQREDLVLALRAQREQWRSEEGSEGRRGGMSKLAATLGLTEQQKQAIHDEIQGQIERAFPERKARREAWEAKMQALQEAFLGDDFDAADFDLGAGAEEAIASFTGYAQQAIDFTGRVLDPSQRRLVASLLRSRAAGL